MGLKGGALDLALKLQDQDQEPAPFRLRHLPPLRKGRKNDCRGNLKLVLSLPPLTGEAAPDGAEGGALDLALKLQDQDQEPAPFRVFDPPSPASQGKGRQLSRRDWNSCCRFPRYAEEGKA